MENQCFSILNTEFYSVPCLYLLTRRLRLDRLYTLSALWNQLLAGAAVDQNCGF
jgi:hypothetical protein